MLPIFDDLCTVNEIQSLSQRLQVAKMIKVIPMQRLNKNLEHRLQRFLE